MKKSTGEKQKKIGRPATGRDPLVALRIPTALISDIERWAKPEHLNRSAAIRRLVELGLTVKQKR